jgi:glycosyltransferase involved in cell wall biosynthesis
MNKQTILIVSDAPHHPSGVANCIKTIVKRLLKQGHTPICIGVTGVKPNAMTETVDLGDGDKVKVYYSESFDNIAQIDSIITKENITAVLLQQDPNKYQNLWNNANYFWAKKLPIIYVSVWDTYLAPLPNGKPHFNCQIYECVDALLHISRQTEWFTNTILSNYKYNTKPLSRYVGHGSNHNIFKPLSKEETATLRSRVFGNKDYKYVAMIANKNLGRKKIADVVEAWQLFLHSLPKDKQDECALLIHSEPITPFGTDLPTVIQSLAPNCNVYLTSEKVPEAILCQLYNIADVFLNVSNAEGYGLCSNEAVLCGTPVILNVTGGLFDQCCFVENGQLVPWTPYSKKNWPTFGHGSWVFPINNQRTIIGSPLTPYLYDENASIDDIANGLHYWYDKDAATREDAGLKGRDYLITVGQVAKDFGINVVQALEETIKNYNQRNLFNTYKI